MIDRLERAWSSLLIRAHVEISKLINKLFFYSLLFVIFNWKVTTFLQWKITINILKLQQILWVVINTIILIRIFNDLWVRKTSKPICIKWWSIFWRIIIYVKENSQWSNFVFLLIRWRHNNLFAEIPLIVNQILVLFWSVKWEIE